MKSSIRSLIFPLTAWLALGAVRAQADTTPELLHYKFSGTGTSVPNLASSPPAGTATATIMGGLTQTGPDLNVGGGGFSLMGSGNSSTTDHLDTGWAPNLGAGSWTIAFISSNFGPSATLFYIFGDANANSFRCFTNGVAGPNNWILRGVGLNDVFVNGGATVAPHRIAFVYDSALNNIKGYLDGALVSTVAQVAPNVTGAGPFKVMGYTTNVGAPAGGLLDDFRVYNRALSALEVAEINIQAIVDVTGNGASIADGDATPDPADDTDFGALPLGGSTSRTFTVANIGNTFLTFGSVSASGAQAADFTVAAQPVSPVAPGSDTTFQVTFGAGALGLRSATLSLPTNDPDRNPFDFAIQGTGVCPAITLGSLPNGTATAPYLASATASGGIGPYTYAVTSGSLPGGLSLTASGAGAGDLSGTPTTAGTYPFEITATDTSGSGTCAGAQTYNVVIDPEPGRDFHTLTPCRILDTRNPAGPLGGPALVALADRDFVVAGVCGIPADTKAISVNLAVTGPTNPGNLRLHPGGTAVPLVSSINFKAGQTRSNNAVIPLSALGSLAAYLDQTAGTAHLILDVNGYFK